MRELMGQKAGVEKMPIGIEQRTLGGGAVVRFVMFESVAANLVAESIEKGKVAVMPRAKQRAGFRPQLAIRRQVFRRHREVSFVVGNYIHYMEGLIGSSGQFDQPLHVMDGV